MSVTEPDRDRVASQVKNLLKFRNSYDHIHSLDLFALLKDVGSVLDNKSQYSFWKRVTA